MAVIGIDLGTTNSLAAYWKEGEVKLIHDENNQVLFPSVVSYVENEGLVVGQQAKIRLLTNSKDTVASFKRFMGTEKKYMLGDSSYSPMELSAMVLERIKRNAEAVLREDVEEAIITVPAYFNDKQRSDTKNAARIAGLHVERLINEPSAAALAYRMNYGERDMSLLVFDFGGGTLDLSYVECFDNIIEIVAVAGDNYLGGDDIDNLIVKYFCEENGLNWDLLQIHEKAELQKKAEDAKQRLETENGAEINFRAGEIEYKVYIDDDILFKICMPLFVKIRKLFIHILKDAGIKASDLDDLIMVGGSSRLSVVRRFLAELMGKEPIVLGETDKVVAMGAGVYSGIRTRNEDIKDILLTDVCPFTLGVECWHKETSMQGYMLPMIERNSTLPSSKCQRLVTLGDYQNEIIVRIYQGEEYYAKDNLFLGEIRIPVVPKPAGQEGIEVYFTYDINGILFVEVVNSQNVRNHILLANQNISKSELERYREEMKQLLIPPIQREENQKILTRLIEHYENSLGEKRTQIGFLIERFTDGLRSNRQHIVKRTIDEVNQRLEQIEKYQNNEEELLFKPLDYEDYDLEDIDE